MSMTAVDIYIDRELKANREGDRRRAYNDKTGKQVTCKTQDPATSGNLTIGRGINLEVGLDDEEDAWLFRHRVEKTQSSLQKIAWYRGLDPVRQSGCLEIAFNEGVEGLLHFPHMTSALAVGDWTEAKKQCHVEDPRLQPRYDAIGNIFLTGIP